LHNKRHTVGAGVVVPQVHLSREAEVVGEVDAGLVPDGAELAICRRGQANRAQIVLPDSAEHEIGSRVSGVAVSRCGRRGCKTQKREHQKRYCPNTNFSDFQPLPPSKRLTILQQT